MSKQRHDQFLVDSREQFLVDSREQIMAAELSDRYAGCLPRAVLVHSAGEFSEEWVLGIIPELHISQGRGWYSNRGSLAWVEHASDLREVSPADEYSVGESVGRVVDSLGLSGGFTVYLVRFEVSRQVGGELNQWCEVEVYQF